MLITSRENPLIKEVSALIRDKKARKISGLFVVEGARACFEAIKSNAEVIRVFVTNDAEKRYSEYIAPLISQSAETFYISESVAEKIGETKDGGA